LAKAQAPWASVTAIAETLTGQPNDSVSEATSLQGAGLLPLRGSLKRTIAIAATGRHHLLLLGPRGVGKTHASEWLLALQPRAEARTSLERAWLAELSSEQTVLPSESSAPVRRIGSQARPPALLGHCSIASDTIRPGEFSLAHGGVLVADEIPEWHRDTRELLREPLESGRVTLNRARGVAELPARFQLVATGNLCPCGGWPSTLTRTAGGDDSGEHAPSCRCSPNRQGQYLERLSGPVLDRTDIVSIVGKSAPLRALGTGAASPARQSDGLERLDFRVREYAELREQVEHARTRCLSRYSKLPSALSSQELEELLSEHPSWKKALGRVLVRGLRSRHKALRVALTLAAWDDAPEPLSAHFVEASFFRPERLGIFG
jgi:magnesium chelatase family protein